MAAVIRGRARARGLCKHATADGMFRLKDVIQSTIHCGGGGGYLPEACPSHPLPQTVLADPPAENAFRTATN